MPTSGFQRFLVRAISWVCVVQTQLIQPVAANTITAESALAVHRGLAPYIIHGLISSGCVMEAEQLNLIANRLVDIAQRATELRRYL